LEQSHLSRSYFRIWVFLFFFVSGATGLIYEVMWTRLLTLVLGNTHYSVSTVLATFMGGLALGSFFGGRLIDRGGKPLLIYALLEGAIGIYCFLIPHFIDASLPFFQWIYSNFQQSYTLTSFSRFLVCGAILLVPASLMGATLPILGKFISGKPEVIGRDVGTLYAVNTFGAVAGVLTSAFVFMKLYGVSTTIWIAAGLNLGLASVILIFFRSQWADTRSAEALPLSEKEPRFYTPEVILILGGFCVTGIASLIYQVAWTRIFFPAVRLVGVCVQLNPDRLYSGTGVGDTGVFPNCRAFCGFEKSIRLASGGYRPVRASGTALLRKSAFGQPLGVPELGPRFFFDSMVEFFNYSCADLYSYVSDGSPVSGCGAAGGAGS